MRDGYDPAEDAAFLARWVQGLPRRTQWLAGRVGVAMDGDPDSLLPVWLWGRAQCRESEYSNRLDVEDVLDLIPDLPEPMTRPGRQQIRRTYAAETLVMMEAVAGYLGQCLQARHPALRWVVYEHGEERIPEDGDPVLVMGDTPDGLGPYPLNAFVFRAMIGLTARTVFHGGTTDDFLRRAFESISADAAVAERELGLGGRSE